MRAVILALELFTLGGNEDMTSVNHSPQLMGETVTVSYVADPSISYGQFRLTNPGPLAFNATVKSAWLELAEQHQPLTEVSVFDTDQDTEISSKGFEVKAESTLNFLIGFPKIKYELHSRDVVAVHLQLSVNGIELQALSQIKFERRIPLNR